MRTATEILENWNPELPKPLRRRCKHCNIKFKATHVRHIYCHKNNCELAADRYFQPLLKRLHERRKREAAGEMFLSSGTVGAAVEMLVCADLIARGFEVYRSVSPHCSGDLIASRNGKYHKIDATLGRLMKNGGISFSKRHDKTRFDIIAAVATDDQRNMAKSHCIAYYPDDFLKDEGGMDF